MTKPTLMAQLVELQEENARLREDAGRYRLIRRECGFDQQVISVSLPSAYSWEIARTGEELDAAIDAARKEQK